MQTTTFVLLAALVGQSLAFQCYVCNNKPEEDDTQECRETLEDCAEGVTSCSSVLFQSGGMTHTRKFCTAPGTPLYQYLMFFPGSSLCQNINTQNAITPPSMRPEPPSMVPQPPSIVPQPPSSRPESPSPVDGPKPPTMQPQPPAPVSRVRRQAPAPQPAIEPAAPAPMQDMDSNLLCVCTTSQCNQGTYREMMDRLLMNNIKDEKKPLLAKQTGNDV